MRDLKYLLFFLLLTVCLTAKGQTPVNAAGPLTINSQYYEPSTGRFPVYRGSTYGWTWPLMWRDSSYYVTPSYANQHFAPISGLNVYQTKIIESKPAPTKTTYSATDSISQIVSNLDSGIKAVPLLTPKASFKRGITVSAQGDSYTVGAGASSTAHDYINLFGNRNGITINNLGSSGGGVVQMFAQAINQTFQSNAGNAAPNTVLDGFNDNIRGGTDPREFEKVHGGYMAFFANQYAATAVPASSGTITQSGSWSALTGGSNFPLKAQKISGTGLQTNTSGSKLTFTTSGATLYIMYIVNDAISTGVVFSDFSVSVDGTPIDTVNTNNKSVAVADSWWSNQYANAAVAYFNLGTGNHTIEITNISNNLLYIDAVGTLLSPSNSPQIMVGSIPKIDSIGYSTHANNPSRATTDSCNLRIQRAIQSFAGYPISYVNIDNFYTSAGIGPDNTHPNNLGHSQIADAFMSQVLSSSDGIYPYITDANTSAEPYGFFGLNGKYSGTTFSRINTANYSDGIVFDTRAAQTRASGLLQTDQSGTSNYLWSSFRNGDFSILGSYLAPTFTSVATLTGAAATNRTFAFNTGTSLRWAIAANNTVESGANAGSNFVINRYSDGGTLIDQVMGIVRSTGVVQFGFTPTFPTQTAGTNTTQGATTAFVNAERSNTFTLTNKTLATASNNITATANRAAQFNVTTGNLEASSVTNTELGNLSGVTSAIQPQLDSKAALASPALTGTPTAPTAATATNTTQIATTAFVKAQGYGTGSVTSITPGVGFTSTTPITTSGTINIDTATTIVSKSYANKYLPKSGGTINGSLVINGTGGNALSVTNGAITAPSVNVDNQISTGGSLNIGNSSSGGTGIFMQDVAGTRKWHLDADASNWFLNYNGGSKLFNVNTSGIFQAQQFKSVATAVGTAGTDSVIVSHSGVLEKIAPDYYATSKANTVSSASTLTLSDGNYTFNGTSTTWTLPVLASSVKSDMLLINMGSGNINLTVQGSDFLWKAGSTFSGLTILPGEVYRIYNNSIYFVEMKL